MHPMPRLIVMGVSGSGKSTVGAELATELGVPFTDGDALHPKDSVAKMASGIPLTDDDRWPWLRMIGQALAGSENGLVVACSALKRVYRETILSAAPDARFVFLDVPKDVLEERVRKRTGHFMPASLLESQLATLEPLEKDEPGFTVAVDGEHIDIAQLAASV